MLSHNFKRAVVASIEAGVTVAGFLIVASLIAEAIEARELAKNLADDFARERMERLRIECNPIKPGAPSPEKDEA